jgi:tetratricopeptide (TPR) repeat protein
MSGTSRSRPPRSTPPRLSSAKLGLAIERYETAARLWATCSWAAPLSREQGQMYMLTAAAGLYAQTGQLARAREYIDRAVAWRSQPRPPNLRQLLAIGTAFIRLGDRAAAVEYLDRSRAAITPSNPNALDWLRDLGAAYLEAGDARKAMDCYAGAIDLARLLHNRLREGRLRAFRAAAERDAGDIDKALDDIEAALPVFESARLTVSNESTRAEYFSTIERHRVRAVTDS